jgi:hypothetical protein
MATARANTSARRISTIPRTGDGSKCGDCPAKSRRRQAIAAKTKRSSGQEGGSDEGGSKGSGSLGVALLASSRSLLGPLPARPDSEPAVAAFPSAAVAERIPEPSRPSDTGLSVAGREAGPWRVVRRVRSRPTAALSRRVRPPLSSPRISRRMSRMTCARRCGEADASKARRRAMLARTWRPDSIRSSRLS